MLDIYYLISVYALDGLVTLCRLTPWHPDSTWRAMPDVVLNMQVHVEGGHGKSSERVSERSVVLWIFGE